MDIYRVSFIGHRDLYSVGEAKERMREIARELIRRKEYVEFYVGRNGDFDILAASVIKSLQNDVGKENNALVLVLPYPVKDMEYYEKFYDDIIIPIAPQTHFKAAITKRNEWMIDNCDLLIAFVERASGGAYKTFRYAEQQGVQTLNLSRL